MVFIDSAFSYDLRLQDPGIVRAGQRMDIRVQPTYGRIDIDLRKS